jgi:hypothetical protein
MKQPLRLLMGIVVTGALVLLGVFVLKSALAPYEQLYAGKSLEYWTNQLTNQTPATSNHAFLTLASVVIPQLTNQMFSDTNDSKLRMAVIDQLNNLPGTHVIYVPADGRRVEAVNELGGLGQHMTIAIPALIQALTSKDDLLCGPAAAALGKIRADPELVVPRLMECMIDEKGHGRPDVVEALGEYGEKAKPAVPILLKLLEDKSSKEIMVAVPQALKKISAGAQGSPP